MEYRVVRADVLFLTEKYEDKYTMSVWDTHFLSTEGLLLYGWD